MASNLIMERRRFLALSAAAPALAREPSVQTVTGPIPASRLDRTLIHEHIITDLRDLADRRVEDYYRSDAIGAAIHYLREVRDLGCRTLVEPTPLHIGRDLEALRILSLATGLQIIGATGIYGAADQRFIPAYAREESAERLAERFVKEIRYGVGQYRARPGIIKTGVNRNTPLPPVEAKAVRAALLAAQETSLTVASHTGPAAPALAQLKILEQLRFPPARFIWVHAQNERDHAKHEQLAREGMWVEFDGVRDSSADWHLDCVRAMAEAGLLNRTLISQDAGWYRPGPERASQYRGYGYLFRNFLPRLRRAGFSQEEIDLLLIENPRRALAG